MFGGYRQVNLQIVAVVNSGLASGSLFMVYDLPLREFLLFSVGISVSNART
jgi:hypothetical protein